jgi:hypothetical protein
MRNSSGTKVHLNGVAKFHYVFLLVVTCFVSDSRRVLQTPPQKIIRGIKVGAAWWQVGNARSQQMQAASIVLLAIWFLAWPTLRPLRWRRKVPLKRWLTFTGLQGVISQKVKLFLIYNVLNQLGNDITLNTRILGRFLTYTGFTEQKIPRFQTTVIQERKHTWRCLYL